MSKKSRLQSTKLYEELRKRNSPYLETIMKIFKYADELLPKINIIFGNYTGHGVEHSIHVMEYMYDLITDISFLSDLEIACLVYSALLHDIGMVVTENEKVKIKNDELTYQGRKYSAVSLKYNDEDSALREFVRGVHGERAAEHITSMEKIYFLVAGDTNCNIQEEIAKICQAHTMNREWICQNLLEKQVKGADTLNAQYIAMLLRVADYLDIDEQRAPIELYKLLQPSGVGEGEWRQHYIVENRDKIERRGNGESSVVVFYGQCHDTKIYIKFMSYLLKLKEELIWCTSHSKQCFDKRYWILVEPQIDNRIEMKGYCVHGVKLNMDYRIVMNLLMGENLYGNRKYGLRELLQNSLDACLLMVEEAEEMEQYRYNPYIPKIQIIWEYDEGNVIVLDNGIGMDFEILTEYFLSIGKSYYKSDEFLFQGKNYQPAGMFGIGFFACFMLSESVVVETKYYKAVEGFTVELEVGDECFGVKNKTNHIAGSGTAIILNKESVQEAFNVQSMIEFIENSFIDQGVHIELIESGFNNSLPQEIKLKGITQLNPRGIVLDSYLDGIAVSWQMDIEALRLCKSFSQICGIEGSNIEAWEYDPKTFQVSKKDLEGEDLQKYIKNEIIQIAVVKGLKKEKEGDYKKKCNDKYAPQEDWQKTIYIPVEDRSIIWLSQNGESDDDIVKGRVVGNGKVVGNTLEERREYCNAHEHLRRIIESGGISSLWIELGVGYVEVISADNGGYLVAEKPQCEGRDIAVYYHGIRLEKCFLEIGLEEIGVKCGKCVVNILRNDFALNGTRDNLLLEERRRLEQEIEKAALQYIVRNIRERELKETLEALASQKISHKKRGLEKHKGTCTKL
ncbi:MAG: ATP-binding protein [Lachnospiraceae bacterium]|nr:ATP-binding protein [Lachnospiraceae bacterium]